jgi:predicted nucleic acid-binding protein
MSAIAWAEFLCGPISPREIDQAARIIDEPVPFTPAHAVIAAELFNAGGRRRGAFNDCMIAACALRDGATLATSNRKDFERFVSKGLVLEAS